MSFWDEVGKVVRQVSTPIHDIIQYPYKQVFGGNSDISRGLRGAMDYPMNQAWGTPPGPEVPEDPAAAEAFRLKQIRDQQLGEAAKFRANLPGYKKDLYNQAENSTRRQLAENIQNVRKSYNRRGLLYSGIRQGGEVGAQADATAKLAQERSAINQELDDTADEYEKLALDSGLKVNQMEMDFQKQLYEKALSRMMAKNQMLGSLFQAGGTVAGAAAAKK